MSALLVFIQSTLHRSWYLLSYAITAHPITQAYMISVYHSQHQNPTQHFPRSGNTSPQCKPSQPTNTLPPTSPLSLKPSPSSPLPTILLHRSRLGVHHPSQLHQICILQHPNISSQPPLPHNPPCQPWGESQRSRSTRAEVLGDIDSARKSLCLIWWCRWLRPLLYVSHTLPPTTLELIHTRQRSRPRFRMLRLWVVAWWILWYVLYDVGLGGALLIACSLMANLSALGFVS